MIWVSLSLNLNKYCHIWNHHPWICLLEKFAEKIKIPIFETMVYWITLNKKLEQILFYLKSAPSNLSHSKILQKKNKILKFQTKNALFGYFWLKILYLDFYEAEFEKAIFIFKISVLEFVFCQILVQKQKSLNLRQKMGDMGIFGLELENNIVI